MSNTIDLIDKSNISSNPKIIELATMLDVSNQNEPYHQNSIMNYNVLCHHDDGFLCEHRLQFILNYIKNNFID
jgi:hypothetical protein